MILSDATLRDLPSVTRILWQHTRRAGAPKPAQNRLHELVLIYKLIRRRQIRIAVFSGDPVAFLARDGARLHALYVAKASCRRGIGKALLREAQAASPELVLYTEQANATARGLYRAHGFFEAEWGRGLGNDEGLADVRMIWRFEGAQP